MQHLILAVALLVSSVLFGQINTEKALAKEKKITVTVINALSDSGKVRFALYDENSFRKIPLFAKSASIENGLSTVTFEDIPVGVYAILCFHDENNNDQMDFHIDGMPIESYGTSGNDMNFGPPNFESSKFELLEKDLNMEIKF